MDLKNYDTTIRTTNMKVITLEELKFVEESEADIVNIDDIDIPDNYKKTRTGTNKKRWAREYYQRNGHFDKPITVIAETNESGEHNRLLLIDEFSRWIAAKQLHIQFVPVKYISIEEYCESRNI